MSKIYSYILKYDSGAAPNPFWGICTLTICKPQIRLKAHIEDWIIGICSKNAKCNNSIHCDPSDRIIYAMKVTDIKTLNEYDRYCKTSLKGKIPDWSSGDWQRMAGDCIYDYSEELEPAIRNSVQNENDRQRDLSGENALLSDRFYYFGEAAEPLPENLKQLIKRGTGHKIIEEVFIISTFEKWISQFERNKIYADPQMRSIFKIKRDNRIIGKCTKMNFDNVVSKPKIKTC